MRRMNVLQAGRYSYFRILERVLSCAFSTTRRKRHEGVIGWF